MMKQFLQIVVLAIVSVYALQAQEEAQYRHYIVNPFYVNPGSAGFSDEHNISLHYQNQWSGFENAPKQFTAAWNGPVSSRIGLGLTFLSDNISFINRTEIKGSYAFKLKVNEVNMSIGLSTSYEEQVLDGEALTNPFVDVSDPVLLEAVSGIESFEAAVGIHGVADKVTFGLVLPDLVNTTINPNDEIEDIDADNNFAFLLYGGYQIELDDYNFNLEPSLMVRQLSDSPLEIDINVKANFFEDQLMGGLMYTVGNGGRLSVLLGSQFDNFGLYYSYGTSFQQFQRYSNGAHEISVAFLFGNRAKTLEEEIPAGSF